jgi:hypothetical protein
MWRIFSKIVEQTAKMSVTPIIIMSCASHIRCGTRMGQKKLGTVGTRGTLETTGTLGTLGTVTLSEPAALLADET